MNYHRLLFFLLLSLLSCSPHPSPTHPIKVVIIGDSTVQTYPPDRPVRGWGQYIGLYFGENVELVNLALSGRSTKTFIEQGLWDKALAAKGDWYFIQFGHNDSHEKGKPESTDAGTDFRENLRKYIDEARGVGAKAVLVTPMHRRTFRANGSLTDILGPYSEAMKTVGKEKKVPVIDLHAASGKVFLELGDAGSASLSSSTTDRTHFSEKGARLMARLVADGIKENVPELRKFLKLTP